jgi:septum formation protein
MSLWLAPHPLIVASRSAVRRRLLESAGIPIDVRPADLDERAVEAGENSAEPDRIAALLAREKARAVARSMPGRLVLGADQVLAIAGRRLTKPNDRASARTQLGLLRGRTHTLHSAIALVRDAVVLHEHVEVARMTMRDFSDGFLETYLDQMGDAVVESVGAYQFEGLGIHLFEHVAGDYHAILGLPLLPLLAFLRRDKYVA